MEFVRTADERFEDLEDYPFQPNYVAVPDDEGGELRIHYVDEGPRDGETILCLHGQPTWSYLYRKMIPLFVEAGYRVVAPDFVGFGRSDKPTQTKDYTYARHVGWLSAFLESLDLQQITLVCQDWGGLIGLRVVAEHPELFARVVAANTGLPDARRTDGSDVPAEAAGPMHSVYDSLPVVDLDGLRDLFSGKLERIEGANPFMYWIKFCAECPTFRPEEFVAMMAVGELSPEVKRAFAAPFPDERSMAGARRFPGLVPIFPDDPAIPDNRAAWDVLREFAKPLLTSWSDDPGVGPADRFQQEIPGARDQSHVTIHGARHFLQEDKGEEFASVVLDFMKENPLS